MGPCPDEETILAFGARTLPPAVAGEVQRHLDGCRDCRWLIAALATPPGGNAKVPEGDLWAGETETRRRDGEGDDPEQDPSSTRSSPIERKTRKKAAPVAVGDVIGGKWVVDRLVGGGGMGFVVGARHVELGNVVAIKVLLADLCKDPDMVARFEREAKAMATIRSEHVVRVHDIGRLPDGSPYFVMDFLEGENLAAVAVRLGGKIPWRLAIELALQTARGLADAHDIGIIHRDIKPSNLFLLGDRKHVLVLDFGIAKLAPAATMNAPRTPDGGRGRPEPATKLTLTSEFLGTPTFMAPEQIASARNVDGRADVWSFGATFYQLITGQPPFLAPSLPVLVALIVDMNRAPRSPQLTVPDLPHEVTALLMQCLEKDRARRPASIRALLEELERIATSSLSTRSKAVGSRETMVIVSPHPSSPSLSASPSSPSSPRIATMQVQNQVPAVARTAPALGPSMRAKVGLVALLAGCVVIGGAIAEVGARLLPRHRVPANASVSAASAPPAHVAPKSADAADAGHRLP